MNGLDGNCSFPTCALDRTSQLLHMQKVADDQDNRQQYPLCRQPRSVYSTDRQIGITHVMAERLESV